MGRKYKKPRLCHFAAVYLITFPMISYTVAKPHRRGYSILSHLHPDLDSGLEPYQQISCFHSDTPDVPFNQIF